MPQSSGQLEVFAEGLPVTEDGPEQVHASSREGDDGLMVAFSLVSCCRFCGQQVGLVEGI